MEPNYHNLKQWDRLSIWQEFSKSIQWSLIKESLQGQARITGMITGSDDKEAFLYSAIRAQVIQELMEYPETQIRIIEQSLKRSS